MPKRKTTKIDVDACIDFAGKKHWKAVDLSEMTGKHRNWLSEVKRGRNLPSPEEAARMCVILDVAPEEILVQEDDIALVKELIAREQKKMPTPMTGSGPEEKVLNLWRMLTPDRQEKFLALLEELAKE